MSLRRFLDTAYYILIEEYQRLGMNLMEALDKTERFRAQTAVTEGGVRVDLGEAATARQNEAAFAQFESLMVGVKT